MRITSACSACDPTGWYVLPLVTGATFLANVERGSEVPMDHETQSKQKTMKNVMRGLAALMIPLTARCCYSVIACAAVSDVSFSFPMAIFAYWIPSNIFTFVQVRTPCVCRQCTHWTPGQRVQDECSQKRARTAGYGCHRSRKQEHCS
jgi:hypothetical protein